MPWRRRQKGGLDRSIDEFSLVNSLKVLKNLKVISKQLPGFSGVRLKVKSGSLLLLEKLSTPLGASGQEHPPVGLTSLEVGQSEKYTKQPSQAYSVISSRREFIGEKWGSCC